MAVVRVNASDGIPVCGDTNPNSLCLWDGRHVGMALGGTMCGDVWMDLGDCWIKPVNQCTAPATLKKGERYLARKVGQYTVGEDSRDLYQIQHSAASGGHVVTMMTNPRWWIDNGPNTGTEDTTTGGYIWHPSPHNRSFRLAFNNTLFNGAGITHDPNAYGVASGNFTITTPGTYVFTVYLQLVGWANSAAISSPPDPPEAYDFMLRLGGSIGNDIFGYESFATDDTETIYGLPTSPSMGTLYQQKVCTISFSLTKTVASTGIFRLTCSRVNDTSDNVTFIAQEFGILVYSATLRIERLS
jgi:hypothetical protein